MTYRNRRIKTSSALMNVEYNHTINTNQKSFKNGEEILNLCNNKEVKSKLENVFDLKTLDEVAKVGCSVGVYTFKYCKLPLTDNYKDVYSIFHEMNEEFGDKCYWVAPYYIDGDGIVSYISLHVNNK